MKTTALLLTAQCCIWIGSLSTLFPVVTAPKPVWADKQVANKVVTDKPVVIETDSDTGFFVEQTHRKDQWIKTLVITSNHHIYRIPDEKVAGFDTGRETGMPHDFHLSPDQKWLFVTKRLFHRVDVGYLYHFDGVGFIRVQPKGLRFDDATLRFFARHIHTPFPTLEAGSRVIHFERWNGTSSGLVFRFGMSDSWDGQHSHLVIGYYGLKSHRFKLILHKRPDEL